MIVEVSDIVISQNGRDIGKYFFVSAIEEGFCMLVDGKGRKLEKPKKKNIKHIKILGKSDNTIAEKLRNDEKITNNEIRRALEQFKADKAEKAEKAEEAEKADEADKAEGGM